MAPPPPANRRYTLLRSTNLKYDILLRATRHLTWWGRASLVAGPRRFLSLKLSDTRVYEPQIRARLGTLVGSGIDEWSRPDMERVGRSSSRSCSDPWNRDPDPPLTCRIVFINSLKNRPQGPFWGGIFLFSHWSLSVFPAGSFQGGIGEGRAEQLALVL